MVIVVKETATGCWECVSHKPGAEGYPRCKAKGKTMPLHRFMFLQHNPGIVPAVVRHTCDNRLCCNPAHLIPGTHADNVADRVARGRSARASRNGRAKLTEDQVREIRADTTTRNTVLAKRYSVDPKVIWEIRNGRSWRTVV